MQALRNSIYLIVAAASVGLAACQPADALVDASSSGMAQIARVSAQWLDDGASFASLSGLIQGRSAHE